MLKFSKANAKTKALAALGYGQVYSLDLPSGYTCPGARDCLSKCVDGKIQDGPDCQFRCFSASQEVVYPAVHKARKHNLGLIKACRGARQIAELILACIPKKAGAIRYHVGGDFFKRTYLQAAMIVADTRKDLTFYGYTKSLPFVAALAGDYGLLKTGELRPNFLLTASRGGKYDALIPLLGIREAVVVFSENKANTLGLPIDHDDSHAIRPGGSFALLLHGIQPAQSEASKALSILRGVGSYTR